MKIKDALNIAKKQIGTKEAIFILCEHLQKNRAELFLDENLDFDEKPFFEFVERFDLGEAFEYIFKKAFFYGYEFYVEKGVLIPRYDSEILLKLLLKVCKENNFTNILEIGFGSGILSIILAKKLNLKIKACDISESALKIAKKNAEIHGVSSLIDFVLCDFKDLENDFDLIFSNPPYIARNYPLDKWVKNEPQEALFGGDKGYECLEKIIHFSKGSKFLLCEFGYDQKNVLKDILDKENFKSEFFKDEQGFDRAFIAQR